MSDTENRPASFSKWEPKEWRPHYEAMVAMSCTGLGNAQISRILKAKYDVEYTPQHVGNILNCTKGEEVRASFLRRMQEEVEQEAGRMARINSKALKRIEQVLDNADLLEQSPFALLDRALAVATKVGALQEKDTNTNGNNTNVQNNFFNMPSELMNQVMGGLNKANEVKVLHASNTKP